MPNDICENWFCSNSTLKDVAMEKNNENNHVTMACFL